MGGYFSEEKKEDPPTRQGVSEFKYVSRFESGSGIHNYSRSEEFDFLTAKDMSGIESLENYGILPVWTLIRIFEYMNLNELLSCSCCCKLFHSIIQTSIFWKLYFENVSGRKYPPTENLIWKHEVFKIFYSFGAKNEYYKKLFYTSVDKKWREKKNKKIERFGDGKRTKYSYGHHSSYDFDLLLKFLLIGDNGVGKSCLLLRKTENSFTRSFLVTIGVDFKIERVVFKNKQIKCQIWDTAGQERFRTITYSYYKGAVGLLICFAIDKKKTFENVRYWYDEAMKFISKDTSIVIVGCKCEKRREVFKEDVVKLCAQLGLDYSLDYCECSAKDNLYCDLPFGMLLDKSLSQYSKIIENEESEKLKFK